MKIITNNVPRPLLPGYAVPREILDRDFDYLGEEADTADFIRYKGEYIYLGDFVRTSGELAALGWDGIRTDSYFSGVAFRFVPDDDDRVIVALVLS
jgi:hypothetical protein